LLSAQEKNMLMLIGNILAVAICLALGALAVRFLVSPAAAADGYGVPARANGDAAAYLSVKGARDVSISLLGIVLVFFAGAHATGLFMLVMTIVPLADAVIVTRNGGKKAVVFGVHISAAALVLLDAVLLLLS
jgi:hypothetical protein